MFIILIFVLTVIQNKTLFVLEHCVETFNTEGLVFLKVGFVL